MVQVDRRCVGVQHLGNRQFACIFGAFETFGIYAEIIDFVDDVLQVALPEIGIQLRAVVIIPICNVQRLHHLAERI